jgi:predicted transcriptional regulator of viral defense system
MTEVWRIDSDSPAQLATPPDRAIADLAARQHGVLCTAQLKALGVSSTNVFERTAAGRLHRVHRGVYAVGHPLLSREGRWMAAVLACGPRALLSHRSAAALWELRPTARARVEVTVPTPSHRSRRGIEIHRARSLTPADRASQRAIPCTSVARTLLDLADVLDRRALARACNQAEISGLSDLGALRDVIARARGRRAAVVLRAVLADAGRSETLTRSELEERFLALCLGAGLPQPRVNAWVALGEIAGDGVDVDFLWPGRRLVVETDGRAVHATRQAFGRDRRRDQRLTVAGYRVVRFTWDQVTRQPAEVTGTLRSLLGPTPAECG